MSKKQSIAIVGAGSLANSLTVALYKAGFQITEIITRNLPGSRRRARTLAAKVGAKVATANSAALSATLLWLCVPDREIRSVASALALRAFTQKNRRLRVAFHSSGALLSRELSSLRPIGVAVASVHPLMTFVAGAGTSLKGVPFALEGEERAKRVARGIVRQLGGQSFSLAPARKVAYHAWATLSSPLLLAFLVTLEEVARAAGLTRHDARRKSLPIITQTLANYSRLGPARSFSGPLIRGDAETVAKHLALLKKHSAARQVYLVLVQAALRTLPVKNLGELSKMLLS
jgi:predicted short-subunit dehydrogenase-like oxidoreductase (DUF2520 family)